MTTTTTTPSPPTAITKLESRIHTLNQHLAAKQVTLQELTEKRESLLKDVEDDEIEAEELKRNLKRVEDAIAEKNKRIDALRPPVNAVTYDTKLIEQKLNTMQDGLMTAKAHFQSCLDAINQCEDSLSPMHTPKLTSTPAATSTTTTTFFVNKTSFPTLNLNKPEDYPVEEEEEEEVPVAAPHHVKKRIPKSLPSEKRVRLHSSDSSSSLPVVNLDSSDEEEEEEEEGGVDDEEEGGESEYEDATPPRRNTPPPPTSITTTKPPPPSQKNEAMSTMLVSGHRIKQLVDTIRELNAEACKLRSPKVRKHAPEYEATLDFKLSYPDTVVSIAKSRVVEFTQTKKKTKSCAVCNATLEAGDDCVRSCYVHFSHAVCVAIMEKCLRKNETPLIYHEDCPFKYTNKGRSCKLLHD